MTKNAPTIALFDVDGVLITPGGYRRASEDTMKIFLTQMGQPQWQPEENLYEQFESYMITSEWDMVPFLLCAFLDHAAAHLQPQHPWNTFSEAASEIKQHPNLPLHPDLSGSIDRIGDIVDGQSGTPSTWVLKAKNNKDFPFLRLRSHPVLEELLTNTRDIQKSLTMRTFQEHIIGSKLFEQCYHLEPKYNVPNYLTQYDLCPVKAETHAELERKSCAGELMLSTYTARPSMPPQGISPNGDGAYAPEAEQALALIPWSNCYLSAYGKVYWLSLHCNFHSEDLLKPSPVQAMSAIFYHFVKDEVTALMWAQRLYRAYLDGEIRSTTVPTDLPRSIILHVFEDSPNGLRGGTLSAEVLRALNIEVELHLWGISDNPQKQTALQAQGGQVFVDVNEAIRTALF